MNRETVKLKVATPDISFVNWIIEGYEHIGVVSTIDRENGIIIIRSTKDMMEDLLKIIDNFTFPVAFIDD